MKRLLSIVVIGLNEELNLAAAIEAIICSKVDNFDKEVIYVDGGSSDNSLAIARSFDNVNTLCVDDPNPSAAKGRNMGIDQARGEYIQLVDGDSILQPGWISVAVNYLDEHDDVDCVFGHIKEIGNTRNWYTRVCSFDWFIPPGEYRFCGGNAMWRRVTFESVGLFDTGFSFGEEPELCYRVRQAGGHIVCIDHPMVKHNLDMDSFKQYWKRAENSGKAYMKVGLKYYKNKEKLWLYESIRNFLEFMSWIFVFGLFTWLFGVMVGFASLVCWWFLRTLRIAYKARSRSASLIEPYMYGIHCQFGRFPVVVGQVKALVFHLFPSEREN